MVHPPFRKNQEAPLNQSCSTFQKKNCTVMAGKSGVPNPGISRNCSNPGGAGLPFCALFFRPRDGILHGLKVRNIPRISKDHVSHDHGIRAYESHRVIHPEDICHNNSAQMQLELGDQVLSHLAKYHELKNHVGAKKDANELQLVLLQIALGALA